MRAKRLIAAASAAALTVGIVAVATPATAAVDICKAKNVKEAGGLDNLVKAAKKEGKLALIITPRSWSNYGLIMDVYEKAFGVKVTVDNPDGSSQYGVDTMKTAPKSKQPDTIEVGPIVVPQLTPPGSKPLTAPYQVINWNDIPSTAKETSGLWYGNYAGKMAIVYDTSLSPAPTKASDFTNPAYKGFVGITGDPTSSNQAFMSVLAASIGNGGEKNLGDVTKGLELFKTIKDQQGALVKVSTSNLGAGAVKLGFMWDFNAVGTIPLAKAAGLNINFAYPTDYVLQAPPYFMGVNAKSPNCANARLWIEFLYSQNKGKTIDQLTPADLKLSGSKLFALMQGGQNYWRQAGADPIMSAAMTKKKLLLPSQLDFEVPATAKIVGPSTIADSVGAREAVIAQWPSIK
ncbi:AfuA ABC-type Fe3+ transport system, periplasmic component [Candidatus Planktophila versatilis]|uniref:ABC transporter substrate-binding protein n=1 Tax=Candidatus Planktophila versatilis TaxID=1884905 RepID=UPI003BEF1F15